jgi:hypothetical protein
MEGETMTLKEAIDLMGEAQNLVRRIKPADVLDTLTLTESTQVTVAGIKLGRAEAYLLTVEDCLNAAIGELSEVPNG